MSYRDILVEVDGSPASHVRGRLAAGLAAKFGARLIGVFAEARIPPPFMPTDVAAVLTAIETQRLYDAHEAAVRKAAEAARTTFEAVAGEAGAQSDWLELGGYDLQDLIACARRVDLVVASPHEGPGLPTADLAIAVGGPMLIAPEISGPAPGRHALVAWNGSREAARALHASWPFLLAADQVHVLVVSRGGLAGPDGFLQRHFEHHGVKPNLIVDQRDDGSAGEIIRNQANALGADLVVMGFYGRSRLQEMVLGGASREMLKHCATPLLISH
ncbi:MAG: universal stress protein [Phenylobacterium sp.]|uniref:universal stress protein n=1 Tax=Phenylobacterium sp. TaxID=1871053 RepID=UPI00120B4CB3|nr:universal stress protein [Phenylobacterium sp.]TAJ69835.1 MAG: universal stress protein [Phenylobacterium sp.]